MLRGGLLTFLMPSDQLGPSCCGCACAVQRLAEGNAQVWLLMCTEAGSKALLHRGVVSCAASCPFYRPVWHREA
jgi:hypothetical protein